MHEKITFIGANALTYHEIQFVLINYMLSQSLSTLIKFS